MRFTEYLKSLIQKGTGESSKSFFLVTVTIMGLFMLLICSFAIIIDVCVNGHIITDLYGMATLIAAITSLFAAAGWTKVNGDKYDGYYPDDRQMNMNKKKDRDDCYSYTPKANDDDIIDSL